MGQHVWERCDTARALLGKGCSHDRLEDPRGSTVLLKNQKITFHPKEQRHQQQHRGVTQLQPQTVRLHLRPGGCRTIAVTERKPFFYFINPRRCLPSSGLSVDQKIRKFGVENHWTLQKSFPSTGVVLPQEFQGLVITVFLTRLPPDFSEVEDTVIPMKTGSKVYRVVVNGTRTQEFTLQREAVDLVGTGYWFRL